MLLPGRRLQYSPRLGESLFLYTGLCLGVTVACYARVSTADQQLDRQIESITDYAQNRLGASLQDVDIYRDKSTGTDTDRSGYQALMDAADAGDIDAVIVHQVSRIARSVSDLESTAERLRDSGVELHIISEGLTMTPDSQDPYQKALFQMLGVFSELEAEIKRQNVREGIAARRQSDEYRHGRAPLGFDKENGELIQQPQYHQICEVLDQVVRDELSQRQAAKQIDSSRRTVRRAINERPELYGL